MRASALAALVVAVAAVGSVGCGGGEPAKQRSRDEVAAACTSAIDEVVTAVMNKHQRLADVPDARIAARVACADLYRRPACARAWTALATPDPQARTRPMTVELATAACAGAYCADFERPLPRGCADAVRIAVGDDGRAAVATLEELDRRILVLEGHAPPVARTLARRAQLFAPVTIEKVLANPGSMVSIDTPAPRPQTMVDVRITATTVEIDGRVVDDAELRAKVAAAVANDPQVAIKISADDHVPYARVVATMDLVKAAGASKIALGIP